jgi:hypothetical protein
MEYRCWPLRFGTAKPRLAGALKPLVSNRLILRCATGVLWQVTAAPRPGIWRSRCAASVRQAYRSGS